jgi:hypothetical protein
VNYTLYVPVRTSGAGVLALRTGRLESGERTGLAFTSVDALARTLGPAQRWVSLGEEPLRDMLAPLGIRQLRVDPLPFGPPATGGVPRQARKRPVTHSATPVTPAGDAGLPGLRSAWPRGGPWPVVPGQGPEGHGPGGRAGRGDWSG